MVRSREPVARIAAYKAGEWQELACGLTFDHSPCCCSPAASAAWRWVSDSCFVGRSRSCSHESAAWGLVWKPAVPHTLSIHREGGQDGSLDCTATDNSAQQVAPVSSTPWDGSSFRAFTPALCPHRLSLSYLPDQLLPCPSTAVHSSRPLLCAQRLLDSTQVVHTKHQSNHVFRAQHQSLLCVQLPCS